MGTVLRQTPLSKRIYQPVSQFFNDVLCIGWQRGYVEVALLD